MVDRRSVQYSRDGTMAPPPPRSSAMPVDKSASFAVPSSIRSDRLRAQLHSEDRQPQQHRAPSAHQQHNGGFAATRSSSRASLVREAYRSPPSKGSNLPSRGRPASVVGRSAPSFQQQRPEQPQPQRHRTSDVRGGAPFAGELMFPQVPPPRPSSAMSRRPPSPGFPQSGASYHAHYTTNASTQGGGGYEPHYSNMRPSSIIRAPSPSSNNSGRPTLPSLSAILPRTMPRPPSPSSISRHPQGAMQLPPMRSRSPSRSRPPPSTTTHSVLGGPGPRPSERDFGAQYSLSAMGGGYSTMSGPLGGSGGGGGWGSFGAEAARNDAEMMGQWGGGIKTRPRSSMGWR